ncbi:MAG: hypothetical protein KJO48_10180 [Ignavibacteria bacterium]|nr:hypothetical protein [Ignavibacteria bacterium]
MKTKTIQQFSATLFLLLSFVLTISAQTSKEATFNVSAGDLLDVSLTQGGIEIVTGNVSEVNVIARNILEEELDFLSMEKVGSKIEIKFEGEDSDEFQLMLNIPSSLNLDLSTGGGGIDIEGDINGKVDASTGGGDINVQTIGGIADLSTGGGNIRTGDINGGADISNGGGEIEVGIINGTADLSTGGGGITITSVMNSADVSTGGGNINVGDIGGEADVSTGGGNIKIGSVSGSVDVSTGGGNITLESAKGKLDVSTGAGNITLKNITGFVDASTGAGDIYAEFIPDGKNESELTTGIGDIELRVPSSAKATIIASTKVIMWSGDDSDLDKIQSDFKPSNVKRNKESKTIEVTYILNGGGSTIELSTGMGEINIKKK